MPAPPLEPIYFAFNRTPIFDLNRAAEVINRTKLELISGDEFSLCQRLNMLGTWYAAMREVEDTQSPSDLKKQLARLSGNTNKLLNNLGHQDDADPIDALSPSILKQLADAADTWADDHPDHELFGRHPEIKGAAHDPAGEDASPITNVQVTVPRGRALVREAIEWTSLLSEWLKTGRSSIDEQVQANKARGKSTYSRDITLDHLILNLGHIYLDAFGKRPTFSNPPDKGTDIDGPFYRFLDACLERYGIHANNRTGHALRERWRRAQAPE